MACFHQRSHLAINPVSLILLRAPTIELPFTFAFTHTFTLCRYPLMREKCFGDWMAGAELLPALMISRWVNLPLTTLRTVPRQLEHHHLDVSAHQPAHSSNPKTFPVLVSTNSLQVLPVLTPFSLSRGDTLSPTGSHPVIQHVYV